MIIMPLPRLSHGRSGGGGGEDGDHFLTVMAVTMFVMGGSLIWMLSSVPDTVRSRNDDTERQIATRMKEHQDHDKAYRDRLNALPFKRGDDVKIKESGKHGVVHDRNLVFVEVSYLDDQGRMQVAKLLWSEIGPWTERRSDTTPETD